MNRKSIAIVSLVLFAILVSVGAASAQAATEAAPQPQQQAQPDNPRHPRHDGQYPHDNGQWQWNTRHDGQFPGWRVHPQPPVVTQPVVTQPVVVAFVAPAQVDVLRQIEASIGTALGLTQAQVNDFRLTETFDQLITAYGQNENTVQDQVAADLKVWVAQGMTDGTISQANGTLILDNLYEIVSRAMIGWFNVNGTTVTGLLNGLS